MLKFENLKSLEQQVASSLQVYFGVPQRPQGSILRLLLLRLSAGTNIAL